MGRGDKKTKRGKISMGSFGVTRPARKPAKTEAPAEQAPEKKTKAPAKKKVATKDAEATTASKPKKTAKAKSEE